MFKFSILIYFNLDLSLIKSLNSLNLYQNITIYTHDKICIRAGNAVVSSVDIHTENSGTKQITAIVGT